MKYNVLFNLVFVSLSTSLVILLLFLTAPLLRKKYSAKWRYYVWLVMALRLLVPFNLSLPQAPVQIPIPDTTAANQILSDNQTIPELLAANEDARELSSGEIGQNASFSPFRLLLGIWVSGMVVFFAIQAGAYLRFYRRIKYSPRQEPPPFMWSILQESGKKQGVTRLPEVRFCGAASSPMLFGLLRPILLLPHNQYSEDELAFIVQHELVHYRRRDLWYKLALCIANGVHWFNPFAYLMVAEATQEVELSCDDEVIKGLENAERLAYGDTILASLPKKGWFEPMFTTSLGGSKNTLKIRLKNLFDYTVKRKGIATFCAVLLLTCCLGGFVTYTSASAASSEEFQKITALSISVDNLRSGEEIKIGEITLQKCELLHYDVKSEVGTGLFIGLRKTGAQMGWYYWSADGGSVTFAPNGAVHQPDNGKTFDQINNFRPTEITGKYDVLVGSIGTDLTNVTGELFLTKDNREKLTLPQKFEQYKKYGMLYDEDSGMATYKGEPVRMFVSFQKEPYSNAFEIFWMQSKLSSTLCLQGTRDSNGKVSGVAPMPEDMVQEILEDLEKDLHESKELDKAGGLGGLGGLGGVGGLAGLDEPEKVKDYDGITVFDEKPSVAYVNFDATYIDNSSGTVVTDKLEKEDGPQTWIQRCDKKQEKGAYLSIQLQESGYKGHIYYNAGRYPWTIDVEGRVINVNLYSDHVLAEENGDFLMRLTSEQNIEEVRLFLDGVPVSWNPV